MFCVASPVKALGLNHVCDKSLADNAMISHAYSTYRAVQR
jgi:hypothetical protein